MAAARGGLPVHILDAVARHVLPQVFELAPFPELAAQANAGIAGSEEKRGRRAVAEIRIDSQRALHREPMPRHPQTERRYGFQVQLGEWMIAARAPRARPVESRAAGRRRGLQHELPGLDA